MRHQRARTVRPSEDNTHRLLRPISKELVGDLEGGMDEDDDDMLYPDHLDKDKHDGEHEIVEQLNININS